MSEIKFNLIDAQQLINGTMHFGVADRCIAALSVDPETIQELEVGLSRFQRLDDVFFSGTRFNVLAPRLDLLDFGRSEAGILIIDLIARIVVCDSTYFEINSRGRVEYHDGNHITDFLISFWLADDWFITESVEEYLALREERHREREANPPLDARAILYGRPLLEFIVQNAWQFTTLNEGSSKRSDEDCDPLSGAVTATHALWLMTNREDLGGQSPRDVILAKQDFVDFDLESRCLQWGFQMVGPPCIPRDSKAYRYAGFGTHEWVLYYDLVRHLIWCAFAELRQGDSLPGECDVDKLIDQLEEIKTSWLTEPSDELDGRIPFIMIDNERKRLPEAMGGRSMVVDEDCPICHAMGDESEAGLGIWFCHLDGCNMDQGFAFSPFRTMEEWEAEQKRWEEMDRECERETKEHEERIARGASLDLNDSFDPLSLDDYFITAPAENEIPEA